MRSNVEQTEAGRYEREECEHCERVVYQLIGANASEEENGLRLYNDLRARIARASQNEDFSAVWLDYLLGDDDAYPSDDVTKGDLWTSDIQTS